MRVRPGVELAGLSDVGCQRENNEDRYSYWEPARRFGVPAEGPAGHCGRWHGRIRRRPGSQPHRGRGHRRGLCQRGRRAIRAPGCCWAFRPRTIASRNTPPSIPTCMAWEPPAPPWPCLTTSFILRTSGTAGCTWCAVLPSHVLPTITPTSAAWFENGILRAEEAESHPQRHILTAALGAGNSVTPDSPPQPVALESGDVLVLCTDGLWGLLSDSEIQKLRSPGKPRRNLRCPGGHRKETRRPGQHHRAGPAHKLSLLYGRH